MPTFFNYHPLWWVEKARNCVAEVTVWDWFPSGMNNPCPVMKSKVSSYSLQACACHPWLLFFLCEVFLCQDGQILLVAFIPPLLQCGWVKRLKERAPEPGSRGLPGTLHTCGWFSGWAESWLDLYGRGSQPLECSLGLLVNLSDLCNILLFPTKGSSLYACPFVGLPYHSVPTIPHNQNSGQSLSQYILPIYKSVPSLLRELVSLQWIIS